MAKPNISYLFDPTQALAPGMVQPGNIDLNKRPAHLNSDGSISSVRSASFQLPNGKAVLLPTVLMDRGRAIIGTRKQVLDHYFRTGRHLGIFQNERQANAYAQMLHLQQAMRYVPGG